ncbi:helix-turn-helix domain-containing protein [Patescibacteria group bacterium]|nr:helix-turn-helix domain-containing protein [Patescibacteria group bacterium]
MVNKLRKNYFSVSELAKILGVSRVAVFKKIKKGEIKAKRFGRFWLIKDKELRNILGKTLTSAQKKFLEKVVAKTVSEYGETLRLLGHE